MNSFKYSGFKDKYYKKGWEEALLWILDLINEDPDCCDTDDIKYAIKKELNDED